MKTVFLLLFLSFSLHAQDKSIFTKAQLWCLSLEVDNYLKEEADPVFVIVESSCRGAKPKQAKLASATKGLLPNPNTIPVDPSRGISADDVREFTKAQLLCIKNHMQSYLNEKNNPIKVGLQCGKN